MKASLVAWALLGGILQGNLGAAEEVLPASAFMFPTLQQAGGARAIGLGSAYVGLAEGPIAVLWNSAGLALLPSAQIGIHHNTALMGASQEIAVLGLPVGNHGGFGASLVYEDSGSFDGRDVNGNQTAAYSAGAYGASLGYGFKVSDGLSMGLAVKAHQQDLAGQASSAFAADLGLLWNFNPDFSLGAAYTNFGPDIDGRQLAQGLRVGVASYVGKGSDYQWLGALSVEALTRGETSFHAGLEHRLLQVLALRAGYGTGADASGLLGWTFGGGILVKSFSIDYAYVPLEDLGNMQRVSLNYAFGPARTRVVTDSSEIDREPILVFSDDDFMSAGLFGKEKLSPGAEARLYQALTQVSAIDSAYIRINGNTSLMNQPYAENNGPQLRAIGEERAGLVVDYLRLKMPRARVTSAVTNGSGKGTPISVFKVVLR